MLLLLFIHERVVDALFGLADFVLDVLRTAGSVRIRLVAGGGLLLVVANLGFHLVNLHY